MGRRLRLAGGAEDVQIAVPVEIVQEGDIVEWRADGMANPTAVIAGVSIPPPARRDVGESIAVQITRQREYGQPRLGGVHAVPFPLVERENAQFHSLVDPDIQSGRIGEWLAQDVEVTVTVEIADLRFMVVHADCNLLQHEMTLAVAVEDAQRRIVVPEQIHLGVEDIEVPVPVEIDDVQAVSMIGVEWKQCARIPRGAVPLVEVQRALAIDRGNRLAVADDEDDLGPATGDDLPDRGAAERLRGIDGVWCVGGAARELEPVAAADDVFDPVTIDVC